MKTKPLLPSLREKKRYLAFEVISEQPIDKQAIFREISKKASEMLGKIEYARAGIAILPEKYNAGEQKGLIRVNHKYLEKLRAVLCVIGTMQNQKVLVRSLGASGMVNKASEYIKLA